MKFNDEQLRTVANLRQYYDTWLAAARTLRELNYRLAWKAVGGRKYLYKIVDRRGNAKSLGPESQEAQSIYEQFNMQKRDARIREHDAYGILEICGRLYRALRLGTISSQAAAILREADLREMLGTQVMVVGTNAMAAYEIEATSRFAIGMDATEDFDLAWSAMSSTTLAVVGSQPPSILGMLKAVDSTYTVNTERRFQARNSKAYEVELLLAPLVAASFPSKEPLQPIPLPEQDWLLQGQMVDQVVCGRDGSPARIVAPDPRWFALHKLWMSEQRKRNPLKREKDAKQGTALLNVIASDMPHFSLDERFETELPDELRPHFLRWKDTSIKNVVRHW